MDKHLIETTYEYAKDKFGKTPFTFKELFNNLLKKDPSIKESASDLYIELLQDIRFISLGNQKWSLREYFTLSEINKITSSMFGLDEYYESDIEGYQPPAPKHEEENDIADFLDEEDNEDLDSKVIISLDDEDLVEEDEMVKSSGASGEKGDDDDADAVDGDEDDDEIVLEEGEIIEEDEDDDEE